VGEKKTSLPKNKIEFDFDTLSWKNLTVEQIHFWEQIYPDVDVVEILSRKMIGWLDAERNGKGRKKKWKSFIVGWLSREQEKYDRFRKMTGGAR